MKEVSFHFPSVMSIEQTNDMTPVTNKWRSSRPDPERSVLLFVASSVHHLLVDEFTSPAHRSWDEVLHDPAVVERMKTNAIFRQYIGQASKDVESRGDGWYSLSDSITLKASRTLKFSHLFRVNRQRNVTQGWLGSSVTASMWVTHLVVCGINDAKRWDVEEAKRVNEELSSRFIDWSIVIADE